MKEIIKDINDIDPLTGYNSFNGTTEEYINHLQIYKAKWKSEGNLKYEKMVDDELRLMNE